MAPRSPKGNDTTEPEIDGMALEQARRAVEDALIDFRDRRISIMGRGNGFVVLEPDGKPSDIMRLGTIEGLAIGIKAYLAALDPRKAAGT